jgi:Cu(I)/Ag(I) efflux system membrane fusion protein
MADVPEQDVGRIRVGDPVSIEVRALPGEAFRGKVSFILPELKTETRTAQVRIELPNPDHKLLHEMYADVTIDAALGSPVLSVPSSAVIDSGLRQVAIVDLGEGKYEPRAVKLGRRGSEHVEVTEGLKEGEMVVTKANFLIDAESNLKAALTALTTTSEAQQ